MTRIYINLSALSFTHCTTVVYCCRLYTWSACCGKMSTKDHKETNSQYKYFRLARLIHLIYIIPPHPSPQPEKKNQLHLLFNKDIFSKFTYYRDLLYRKHTTRWAYLSLEQQRGYTEVRNISGGRAAEFLGQPSSCLRHTARQRGR